MLRNHHFGGGSFYLSAFDPLQELVNRAVEHEFVDDELGYVLPSFKLRESS